MKGEKLQREILRLLKILIELQLCASSVQSNENVTLNQMDVVLMGPDLTVMNISTVSKGTVGEKGEGTRKTKDTLCIWCSPKCHHRLPHRVLNPSLTLSAILNWWGRLERA